MDNTFTINSSFEKFKEVFLLENSKLNLISKNDEMFLEEKHIYDSLSIKLFESKYGMKDNLTLLDIGCGGGFPSVPIAIEYPNIQVTAIDSIKKKINAIKSIKNALNLNNLSAVCDRAENIKNVKFDIITSRAVAELAKITEYALPLLKKDGYFIAYKAKKAQDEILKAETILKKYNAKITDIIEYTLPLETIYQRNLIVIQFNR